jgi:hypothetical protein
MRAKKRITWSYSRRCKYYFDALHSGFTIAKEGNLFILRDSKRWDFQFISSFKKLKDAQKCAEIINNG